MLNDWLPLIILSVAFITAVSMLLIDEKSENLRTSVNLISAALNIVLIGLMIIGVFNGETFETRLPLLPDINLVLHADALSLVFVALSGILWFFTTIYAVGYFKHGKHRSRFFGFFSLCVFSTLGIALAGNLVTFLLFYELLTLATYPLIVHKGNEASLQSGKIYLRYTMIGGAVLLVAVVWLKSFAGALDFSLFVRLDSLPGIDPLILTIIFIMLIGGLGVKAALFPFHSWLPRAMAAPAPVSSLLHAVAVVKAGAFGIIRVVYDVYGIDLANSLGVLQWLVVMASITIIYGSIRAIFQDDIKKRLAYSTVSQVSYITLGVALAGPFAAVGAIVHLVHQGLMKITMFFCAGNLAETHHIYKISELDGIGRRMPITMSAFTLAILGMIGIPPLAGFVSKWYLGIGAIQSDAFWVQLVLAGSSLLNAIYFLPIVYRAWFKPLAQDHDESKYLKKEAYWMMLLPPVVTITLALAVGLFAASAFSPLNWAKLIARAPDYGFTEILRESTVNMLQFDPSNLLLILIAIPFCISLIGLLFPRLSQFKWMLPVSALLTIIFAASAPNSIQTIPFLFFGSELVFADINRHFLLLAATLWFLATTYAIFYHHLPQNARQFFIFFSICMGSSFGLVLSNDMFGFITFFTLMSLSSYVLIILSGTSESQSAATNYIKWVIVGEVALFVGFCFLNGMLLSNDELQRFEMSQIVAVMLLIGFGIKMGLFGLHGWLPKAHPVAAIPASAMLSGFMVNAGIIGLLKFFPFASQNITIGIAFIVLGLCGNVYAAIRGITKSNPKEVLAYSTVSQMGIVAAVFGAILALPDLRSELTLAIVFYCLHHGLAKCLLFLSVGLTPHLAKKSIFQFFAYCVIALPALTLIGLPWLSGYVAKAEIKVLLADFVWVKNILIVSSTLTTILMLKFLDTLQYKAKITEEKVPVSKSDNILLAICGINGALVLALPFYWVESEKLLSISLGSLISGCLPAILGLAIYIFIRKFVNRPISISSHSERFDPRIAINYLVTVGTSIKQLTSMIFEQKIKPKFAAHTSPRESTGETMQSYYVSLLLILICIGCFLALYIKI